MSINWNDLGFNLPDFSKVPALLKACATIVIDGIRDCIENETKPDGSPQKQNSVNYAALKAHVKGYTTPLKGISDESPYLATRKPWLHEMVDDYTVAIRLRPKRAKIVAILEAKQYYIFDFPKGIMPKVYKRMDQWFKNEIRKMTK